MDTELSRAAMANDLNNMMEAHIATTPESELPNRIFNTD